MTLRVVGAGLGRTGTHSLKLAFEQLLGAPCYHMLEVFQHPDDIEQWQSAADGVMPDWHQIVRQLSSGSRLARVRILARIGRRVSRCDRRLVDSSNRRMVAQRGPHHLGGGAPPRAP